ncbi:MAG TPA: helix-turn-helix transcriptional regulator [Longimicrobium sp.]|nr:helix-turn-helix transcriptional regulator [Longimicrobium sp.]
MLKSIALRPRTAARTADPASIRSAREAAGWTQDELADLLGVLPVEITAWEAGSIALSPYEGELIRWKIANALYEERLPRHPPEECAWLSGRRPQLDRLKERRPWRAGWVARTIAAHQRECPVCQRAQALAGGLPPRPLPPVAPGLLSWVSRLPTGLRVPVKAAGIGVAVGISVALMSVPDWLGGAPFDPDTPLLWGAVVASLAFTYRLLRPLGDRKPLLAGQLQAAVLVVPAMLIVHDPQDLALDRPLLWLFVAMFSGLIGALLGAVYDPRTDAID